MPCADPTRTGRPQRRAGDPVGEALVTGDDPDALGAALPDRVLLEKILVVGDPLRDPLQDLLDVVFPAVGQVGGHAPGPDVVVVHPQPGGLLEEGEDQLAFPEAVDHHREGTDVHAVGGGGDQVAGDPVELGHQHADGVGPGRELDSQQLLHSQRVAELVVQRSQVVHAGDVGAALQVGERLGGLLHAGVEVADDGLDPPDDLAFELEVEPQYPVCRRMLGTHVDDHPLVVGYRIIDHEVVHDPRAALLDDPALGLVTLHDLGALVGARHDPVGFFGAGHPEFGPRTVCHHCTWWASLNCTGTAPTP